MSQLNLLERAKNGESQAIAIILNKALQPKGVKAIVGLEGDCLQVVLHSSQQLNVYRSSSLVFKAVQKLQPRAISHLLVCGQLLEETVPAWSQTFTLGQGPATLIAPQVQTTLALVSEESIAEEVPSLDYPLRPQVEPVAARVLPDPDLVLAGGGANPTNRGGITRPKPATKQRSAVDNTASEISTPTQVSSDLTAAAIGEDAAAPTTATTSHLVETLLPADLHQEHTEQTQPNTTNQLVKTMSVLVGLIYLVIGVGLVLGIPLLFDWIASLGSVTTSILTGLSFGVTGLGLIFGLPLLLNRSSMPER